MFKVIWKNYGKIDFKSSDFVLLEFDVSRHGLWFETAKGICHFLRCDYSPIFNDLYNIIKSKEFQNESLDKDNCDGDWYIFEYDFDDKHIRDEGFIYNLEVHQKVIDLIKSCANEHLDDEQFLLTDKSDKSREYAIIKKRQNLYEMTLDDWDDFF